MLIELNLAYEANHWDVENLNSSNKKLFLGYLGTKKSPQTGAFKYVYVEGTYSMISAFTVLATFTVYAPAAMPDTSIVWLLSPAVIAD